MLTWFPEEVHALQYGVLKDFTKAPRGCVVVLNLIKMEGFRRNKPQIHQSIVWGHSKPHDPSVRFGDQIICIACFQEVVQFLNVGFEGSFVLRFLQLGLLSAVLELSEMSACFLLKKKRGNMVG